jgi:signal transduction histidine kinase
MSLAQRHPLAEVDGPLALVKAVERLATADGLEEIIDIVRATARDISGADGVSFVLRDGELCHYVEENAVGPLWKGKRFPLTACISGWCMLNDRTAAIPDIYLDARIPHDAYRPTFVKSLVMVPVRVGHPIAAIGAYWARVREFSEDELALLEALGRSTAAAIAAAQLRDTLRDREHRLSMALDAGGLGAWEFDLNARTLEATPACKAVFGCDADAPLALQDLIAAIHPDDRAQAQTVFRPGPQPGTDTEYRIAGGRRIELRGRLVLDADDRPSRVAGVVRDVSDRHQAKERLDTLRSELAHVARLNDLGEMASALAHELNQPLSAASNYMKAAQRFMAGDDRSQALSAIVKAEAQFDRTKAIIQRIRGFAGRAHAARTKEDIGAVIAEVIDLAKVDPQHKGVALTVALDGELPWVEIDKVQIQQVLLNLLRNAFEATAGREGRAVSVGARQRAAMVEVSVRDNGPGLAPEIAEHLFQPFHTTKEGGMGVGLSICRGIVEAHGGEMWSEPGDGAAFCFTVPVA